MLTLLYPRENRRAGQDLNLVVAGVFANELIQVFRYNPDGIANLNRRKLFLLDEFVNKSFAAVQDICYFGRFQQFSGGWVGDLVHVLLLIV